MDARQASSHLEVIRTLMEHSPQACPQCSAEGHDATARYCKDCGAQL